MPAGTQVASLFAKISADVKDFERGMKSVKSDLTAGEKLAHGLGTALVTAFKVAAAAAAAFAGGVGLAVKKAADMEQQVADINAIMGLTSEEVERLDKLILDLGLDPNLKVSATEAADAIQMLGKNGVTMSQIMDGAARSTVLLANATDADFATAADVATDVMQQFNISAANMNDAVNGIAGVTQSSKFDINDYRLAVGMAGGVAASVGVEFDDFNAILAATAQTFNGGSDAGTAFRTFLGTMVPKSKEAEKAMQELGIEFFTASGAMKSGEEIAQELRDAFGGLTEAQKIETATTIFGTDAQRMAFALVRTGTGDIERMKAVIGKVDAEEMAAKRMDTFAGALEILGGVMESLQIQIGQAFLPPLRSIVEAFTALASKYGPPVVAWFGQFAGILEASGRYLAAWIDDGDYLNDWLSHLPEPLEQAFLWFRDVSLMVKEFWANLQIAIKVIQAIVEPLINALSKWVSWKDVLTAVGLILGGTLLVAIGGFIAAMWPVIALIAQVTAAVAVLRWAWTNDFMNIRSITEQTLSKISNWFKEHIGPIKNLWEGTSTFMMGDTRVKVPLIVAMFLGQLKYWVYQAEIYVKGFIANWKHQLSVWKSEVKYVIDTFVADSKSKFEHWVSVTKEKVTFWVDHWEYKLGQWASHSKYLLDEFLADVKEFRDTYFGWFRPEDWAQMARNWIQGLWNGVTEKWNQFTQWWRDRWQNLKDGWNQFWQSHSPSQWFYDQGAGWMAGLTGGVASGVSAVQSVIDKLNSDIQSGVIKSFEVFEDNSYRILQLSGAITMGVIKNGELMMTSWKAAADTIKAVTTAALPPGMKLDASGALYSDQITTSPNLGAPPTAGRTFSEDAAKILANNLTTRVTDVHGWLDSFVAQFMAAASAPGQAQLSAAGSVANAAKVVSASEAVNVSAASVLAALNTLIAEIKARGLGSAFSVNMAPAATGDTAADIRATVDYLQALYA